VAQDDDGGEGNNSRIVRTLAPGTYTLEATTFARANTGSFNLVLRTGSGSGGGCLQTAALNATTAGSWTNACASTHARYYTFTLTTPARVQIDLASVTDTYLFLLNGGATNGNILVQDDDGGDGNNSRIVRNLSPGTYTIEATTFSAGRTGSFTLGIRTTDAAAGCISPLALNATTGGAWTDDCASVHRSGRYARFYTFSLSSFQEIQIDLSSPSVDSFLYLLQGSGTTGPVLFSDDDSGGSNNSRIRATLAPGAYTVEATTFAAGRTGSFALSAGAPPGTTIFLIHGLGQGGGALDSLARTLADPNFGIDLTRFRIDSGFDWGRCANRNGCDPDECEVSDGGRALAQYISGRNPSGPIVLLGYSLGGLIARDMMLNNYDNVLGSRRVAALITLGSPHVGYPYCEIDDLARCDVLIQQMASHFRVRQAENLVVVSNYLFDLNERWGRSSFVGLPGRWLAAAGTFCSEDRFCEWNSVDRSEDQGCTDNTPQSDGVVCAASAHFQLNLGNIPSQRWADANYAHTDNGRSWVVMCGNRDPNRFHALFNPPANGTLVRAVKDLINGLP
jgi:pimeloyl-ACP methyl ester carboxylesterase